MRRKIKRLSLTVLMVFCSGCGVFMPFRSEFQCNAPYKGKCVSVKEAYAESKGGGAGDKVDAKNKGADTGSKVAVEETSMDYRKNLQRELSKLLRAPVTPVIMPPKVIRILILPYPDRSVLYMPRYIYMMTDKPEWVIGNYLTGKERH